MERCASKDSHSPRLQIRRLLQRNFHHVNMSFLSCETGQVSVGHHWQFALPPFFNNSGTTFAFPCHAAKCNGLYPLTSLLSIMGDILTPTFAKDIFLESDNSKGVGTAFAVCLLSAIFLESGPRAHGLTYDAVNQTPSYQPRKAVDIVGPG